MPGAATVSGARGVAHEARESGPQATSSPARKGESTMASGKTDEMKGRVKEAAGALSGDAKLKREGRIDQTVGKVKQKTEEVLDKVKKAVRWAFPPIELPGSAAGSRAVHSMRIFCSA